MRIVGIVLAVFSLLIGIRLIMTAFQTLFSGKILVRQKMRSQWQPALTKDSLRKAVLRDGIMGLLLIVLAITLIT